MKPAAAILLILAALSFVGSQIARSAAREIAAPLAGLERLAHSRPSPDPAEPALFSWEHFEVSPVTDAEDEDLAAHPTLADSPAEDLLPAYIERVHRGRLLINQDAGHLELTLDGLPQLERELQLSPLQRERIEQLLVQREKALETLAIFADIDEYVIIGMNTHDAVRAELDYFQAEEFDRRLQPRGFDIAIDLNNHPPVGGYDIGGVGFTDIDEGYVTLEQARLEVYDLRASVQAMDKLAVLIRTTK